MNQITHKLIRISLLSAVLLMASTSFNVARAQSSEALIEALVRKGVLTEQEAEDIKADLTKESSKSFKVTASGKETANINLYGDFRGRFDAIFSNNPLWVDRNRFRYRLRAGVTATFYDQFEVGFRLTSGEANSSFGGDPISGNASFADNASKKFVFIDLAYGKWTAVTNSDWSVALTLGKMENPFVFSDLVFDHDYTPEGLAAQIIYNVSDQHALKFNLAGFALDEVKTSSRDPFMFGAQARFDSTWQLSEDHKPKLQTSIGLAFLGIMADQNLTNGAVPNINFGNTRNDAVGRPAVNYNPIVVDASATYTLARFPGYAAPFPIKVGGDYMNNLAASTKNQAYSVGITFGKAGKKGLWDIGYRWKYLGGDAWFEEFTDSDFGGFYPSTPASLNWGSTGADYRPGTNLRGHVVKATYSPYNSMTLGVTWWLVSPIDKISATSETSISRVQVDAVWKF